MLTPSHGLVAWLAGKWLFRSRPEMIKFLVLGSMVSDIAMILRGLMGLLAGQAIGDAYRQIYRTIFVRDLTTALHSFIIVIPVFILIALRSGPRPVLLKKVKFFLGGMLFFHVALDFLTHDHFGHRQFWPISNWIFRGLISDENIYFAIFDGLFSLVGIVVFLFLFNKKSRA